jgi:hypothetical protein
LENIIAGYGNLQITGGKSEDQSGDLQDARGTGYFNIRGSAEIFSPFSVTAV